MHRCTKEIFIFRKLINSQDRNVKIYMINELSISAESDRKVNLSRAIVIYFAYRKEIKFQFVVWLKCSRE